MPAGEGRRPSGGSGMAPSLAGRQLLGASSCQGGESGAVERLSRQPSRSCGAPHGRHPACCTVT
ncbi:hypothetical protein FRAAL2689 [Frankia alni ACN14a]|uniref:Uncharacterized protein n=1 Tax=Frankia alni (strain DSM 45986 / CECT 9034 / ACN14a) TaxID=326424 RepID=Q0RMB6_FRAAA|nr:hypothetical protein FRAAL2689 [Frankia alni ACN14a]